MSKRDRENWAQQYENQKDKREAEQIRELISVQKEKMYNTESEKERRTAVKNLYKLYNRLYMEFDFQDNEKQEFELIQTKWKKIIQQMKEEIEQSAEKYQHSYIKQISNINEIEQIQNEMKDVEEICDKYKQLKKDGIINTEEIKKLSFFEARLNELKEREYHLKDSEHAYWVEYKKDEEDLEL